MMKNLTVAIFLTLFFCTVSGTCEETAGGFQQNPEYAVPAPNKTEAPVQQQNGPSDNAGEKINAPVQQQKDPSDNADEKTYVRNRSSNDSNQNSNRRTAFQRRSNTAKQAGFSGTTDPELKAWELRNRPVPSSLPRVTNFRSRSGSCSRNFRNYRCYKNSYWSDGYYYRSSSSRIRISTGSNGNTRIQIRNHR